MMEEMVGRKLGKYELLQALGEGGMGAVYRSLHPQFNRPVAIKILPPLVGHDPSFRARFQREGQTMAELNHANIIRIYDVDEQDGLYYMVMDFVEGGSLAQRLDSGMPMGLYWACDLIARVAEALHYAHRKGVVHRDIKPANILLTAEDDPVIADFGIAKMMRAEGENLTAAGSVVGTPAYMAPEQILGGEVDARSDLYSLAIVLYQLLTGHQPFRGDTMAVITQQINAEPPPPRQYIPELPKPLEEVVLQALSKQPAHRFSNGAAFAAAVRNALQTVGPSGFVRAAPAAAAAAAVAATPAMAQTVAELPATTTAEINVEGNKQVIKLVGGGIAAIVALVIVWQIIKALFWPLLILAILGGGFYLYRAHKKKEAAAGETGGAAHASSLVQRGLELYRGGQFAEAMACFNQALGEDSQNIDALISRGLAFYTLGDVASAEADFEAALQINPRHPRALYQRALVHQALGREEAAKQDLEQVLAIIPAQAQLRREAEARLQSLTKQEPDDGAHGAQGQADATVVAVPLPAQSPAADATMMPSSPQSADEPPAEPAPDATILPPAAARSAAETVVLPQQSQEQQSQEQQSQEQQSQEQAEAGQPEQQGNDSSEDATVAIALPPAEAADEQQKPVDAAENDKSS